MSNHAKRTEKWRWPRQSGGSKNAEKRESKRQRRKGEEREEETVRSGYKVLECDRACFRVMSLESRSSSALFKRAEQLKRWEQSETNREPAVPRQVARKIKFSTDCVFLAACAAGDKEEIVRLLQKGADINTGNVDGLTALHQV